MPGERLQALTRLCAPHPSCAVVGGARDPPAVRREFARLDTAVLARELAQHLPGLCTPQLPLAIEGNREQRQSARGECGRLHLATELCQQHLPAITALQIPDPRGAVERCREAEEGRLDEENRIAVVHPGLLQGHAVVQHLGLEDKVEGDPALPRLLQHCLSQVASCGVPVGPDLGEEVPAHRMANRDMELLAHLSLDLCELRFHIVQ
mmetsp:Transcript_9276/g.19913  ORF Transcript_9276/g.19913 Transcript_9276/m.19913 type:complete len:208 (+) Transcript_9276:555-1178(+)